MGEKSFSWYKVIRFFIITEREAEALRKRHLLALLRLSRVLSWWKLIPYEARWEWPGNEKVLYFLLEYKSSSEASEFNTSRYNYLAPLLESDETTNDIGWQAPARESQEDVWLMDGGCLVAHCRRDTRLIIH